MTTSKGTKQPRRVTPVLQQSDHAVTFFVEGRPVPKGSMIARLIKGKAVALPDSKYRPWARLVRRHAEAVMAEVRGAGGTWPWSIAHWPTSMAVEFKLARPLRPASAAGPVVAPDVDKLLRAVLDALKDAAALADDGQVLEVALSKRFCAAGESQGVAVTFLRS